MYDRGYLSLQNYRTFKLKPSRVIEIKTSMNIQTNKQTKTHPKTILRLHLTSD